MRTASFYLAEYREFVVRQETVDFIEEKVASDELLEAPVLPLHEAVRALALWK